MTADELADAAFRDEADGIELVNQRIAQITQLRARLQQLSAARRGKQTLTLADELSLTAFRHYEARFMLDKLLARLKQLRNRRAKLMASARP